MRFIKILTLTIFIGFSFAIALPNSKTTATNGVIGQWQNATPLPSARIDFALVRSDNYLYMVGGCVNSCMGLGELPWGPTQVVERAQISSGGDIGTWQNLTPMAQHRKGAAAAIVGNYLYALGGYNGQTLSSVERAPINADGSLGSWQFLNSMTTPRFDFAVVVIGNYLYAIGGSGAYPSGIQNSVERASINSDGTLSTWEPVASMTTARTEFAAFVAGNYVYALGGGGQPSLDTIERASIGPDGSINSWQVITSMPTGRRAFAAVYVDGDLYVLGGWSTTVDKTTVNPDGSIGPWLPMPSMLTERAYHGAIAINPYLYAIGGTNISVSGLRSVERATIIEDTTPPVVDSFAINGGALASMSQNVTLTVSASDSQTWVTLMSFSNDGVTWGAWQNYSPSSGWLLTSGDGLKTVYARVKDMAGNVSSVAQSSIELNTSVGTDYALTVNNGALFTNDTAVTLTISARPGVSQMQISNDGGFAHAVWEPYTVHRPWTITRYGSYVVPRVVYVRYKDVDGAISATFQDDIILEVTPIRPVDGYLVPVNRVGLVAPWLGLAAVVVLVMLAGAVSLRRSRG